MGLSAALLANPAALGLSGVQPAGLAALGLSHQALGSASLGLWVGQFTSALGAHPPDISGVGPQSANLGVCQPGFR